MKIPHLALFALGLQAHRSLAAFRPDLQGRVEVGQLEPDQTVAYGETQIPMKLPHSDFVVVFTCSSPGKEFRFNGPFVACCFTEQHLSGSEDTLFDCCGAGHDITGSRATGYACCLSGHTFDGKKCSPPVIRPVYDEHQHILVGDTQGGNTQGGGQGNTQGGNTQGGGPGNTQGGNTQGGGGQGNTQGGNTQGGGGQGNTQGGNTQGGGWGNTQGGNTQGGGWGNTQGGNTQGGCACGPGNTQGGNTQGGGQGNTQGGNTQGGGGNTQGGNTQGGGGNTQGGNTQGGNTQGGGGNGTTAVCPYGKYPSDVGCQCPIGQVEGPDGICRTYHCTSGIVTGKCYQIKMKGQPLGYHIPQPGAPYYGPGPESRNQRAGKFKFCRDAVCTPGRPVNPADGVAIKDMNGDPNTGANAGNWLNNASDGGHIGKTPNWQDAGWFTITKWPCGKYCLGGKDAGVGPTCPADVTGSTFLTADKDSCVEVELLEVPCNNHALENNCIWKGGNDQCCGKVDCSKEAQRAKYAAQHSQ